MAADWDAREESARDWRRAIRAALEMHRAWLSDPSTGARLVTTGRTLRAPDRPLLSGCTERDLFRRADLRGSDLRGSDLRDLDLGYADLREADLRGADLRGADLRRADMRGADLRGARLRVSLWHCAIGSSSEHVRHAWAGVRVEGVDVDLANGGEVVWGDVLAVARAGGDEEGPW